MVIVPIVEGHGEIEAVPVLLQRLSIVLAPDNYTEVRRPIRVRKGVLVKHDQLARYVELAARQHGGTGATLVLFDADDDCAATLGPELQAVAESVRPGALVAVVMAVHEFEAWLIAAAESLRGRRGLPIDLEAPPTPEAIRDAKGWLRKQRVDGLSYSPTVDQPALTAAFDLDVARARCPSFDKLARELERFLKT